MQRSRERQKTRFQGWDYSRPGWYFVTICVQDRGCVFGDVVEDEMHPNQWGAVAQECWGEIPAHFEGVVVDEFIVMPNHVHGIVVIEDGGDCTDKACLVPTSAERRGMLLSTVIGSFKSSVTRKIHQNSGDYFGWQRSFYDRIIRDELELQNIRQYIRFNASKWCEDEFFHSKIA